MQILFKTMYSLLRKEFTFYFISSMGWITLAAWLLATGLMLWVFGGDYNILNGGYATLRPFFELSPILMILIIPAITMRSYAEERKNGTLELLFSHPISPIKILFTKQIAAWGIMIIALLITLIYMITLSSISLQGIDFGEIIGGYIGLFFLAGAFVSIGLFCSSWTENQLTAYLTGASFLFLFYFGFSLIASLTQNGALYNSWENIGMLAQFEPMTHGIINSASIVYFISVIAFFSLMTLWIQNRSFAITRIKKLMIGTALLLGLNLLTMHYTLRWDLTEEKRYTLSIQTQKLLKSLDHPLEIILYLNGSLNPSFHRLRTATTDLLTEMAGYTNQDIKLTLINPSDAKDETEREEHFRILTQKGITGLSVNEKNSDGKVTAQVLFPWAELVYEGDTLSVPLLRRNVLYTPQQMLHASSGDLEYSFTDALRVLTLKDPKRIAFIEGHGELTEPDLYEAFNALSRYYQIDRGPLGGDPSALTPYKVLVIADPQTPFSEEEKFALDQYLMQGGSVLFLSGGTTYNPQTFQLTGESPTLKRELNLDDLWFTYGFRIEPITLQDLQCTSITLTAASNKVDGQNTILPWFFAPLLLPTKHSLTAPISPLKSEYVSPVTLVNNHPGTQKQVLLTTSPNTHSLPVPEKISLRYVDMPATENYFNEPSQPVGILLEGTLPSAYTRRLSPENSRELPKGRLTEGDNSRLIAIGSGSILKNEWEGTGQNTRPLPLGYDPNSRTQLGNEDFLIQSISYLARDEEWLNLRGKNYRIRMLSQEAITFQRPIWQFVNVILPLVLLFIAMFVFRYRRAKRFFRKNA